MSPEPLRLTYPEGWPPPPKPSPSRAAPAAGCRPALTERKLREEATMPEWEHDGLTHRGGRTLLVGPRGQHKTRVLAALLGASVTGGACYGAQATRHGPVYAVIAEDLPGWKARWFAWRRAHEVAEDVDLPLHTRVEPLNLFTGAGFDALLADIARVDPIVIGLDPLSDLVTGADENSTKDMGIVRDRLKLLTRPGRSVIACHHTGYNERRERGSSVLGAMADTILLMEAADDDTGALVMTCTKQKNAAPFPPRHLAFDAEALVLRPVAVETLSADGRMPVWRRLQDALRQGAKPLPVVAAEIDAKVDTVRRTIERKRRLFVQMSGERIGLRSHA